MKPTATISVEHEADTEHLARCLAPHLAGGQLLVLSGSLGAGKTFFTRALCRALGLPEDQRVQSPTFALVHPYDTRPPVAHADLYRLGSASEVADLGLEELREEGWLLVVEWGEPYVELLGGDALVVSFWLDPRRAGLRATGLESMRVQNAFEEC